MKSNKQMSETFLIGAILATVGGFLDAYTYICRGGVFANAQTGNIVLVGISLAKGNTSGCFLYIIPVISFVLGIVVAEYIRQCFRKNNKIHWRQMVIAFETAVLVVIAFLPEKNNMLANILVSFVCSLQVQSFRKINGKTYATTMCTGNFRSATECLYAYKITGNRVDLKNSLQYYGIITFFILGAIIGTQLVGIFEYKAVLFACGSFIIVFILMLK